MRDIQHNLGIYSYIPIEGATLSINGAFVGREFDTATGGQPERIIENNYPGDYMYPTQGALIIKVGPTVGSAMTLIDIDHRNRSNLAWAELLSAADTANAANNSVCFFHGFRRFIRVTGTITTSDVCIMLLFDRGKRLPVLNPDEEHGGYTELAPTYA